MESGKSTKSFKSLVIYSQASKMVLNGFRVRWKVGKKYEKHKAPA